jgi:hypothetical protein
MSKKSRPLAVVAGSDLANYPLRDESPVTFHTAPGTE